MASPTDSPSPEKLSLQETESLLRQSAEHHALALEAAGVGAWSRDFARNEAIWDDGVKRLFGIPASTPRKNLDLTPYIAKQHLVRIEKELERTRLQREDFFIEFPIQRADGKRRHLRAIGRPRLSDSGPVLYIDGVIYDVTELHQAEELLSRSEERFRATFERTSVGMTHVSLDGKFLQVNDRLCEIIGYDREELLSKTFQEITHPDDLTQDLENFTSLIAGKTQRYNMEKRYFHKRGHIVWIYLTVSVLRDDHGKPLYVISAIEDISERKENDQLLRKGQERLEAALVASGTGTFRWNIRTNALEWDENLDRLFGLVPGKTAQNLDQFISMVHPDDRAEVIRRCEACAAKGADFEMEFRVIWPDGTTHWLYDRGKTYRDWEGRPAYMTGACVDITSRKQTEASLHVSQERWLLAQSVASAGIYDVDMRTGAQSWSEENFRLLGLPVTAQALTAEQFRSIVHEEDIHLLDAAHNAIENGANAIDLEFRVILPDGSLRWITTRAKVSRDAQGNALRLLGVNYETTARKVAEEALRKSEKLAVVGRLAASIAHEINNPLEAVTNLLYLMTYDQHMSDESRKYLEEAQDQLQRVAHVATQTLRFYRQSTRPTLTQIHEVVESVLALYTGRLASAGTVVHLDEQPGVELVCLANELKQVLANLVGNSIDATRNGKIILRTRRIKDWRDGRTGVRITVADTGEGMSPETRRRLFEPFFSTKGITGTGLGLWVSAEIIAKHHGRILVRSTRHPEQHGTIFSIFLPDQTAGETGSHPPQTSAAKISIH